MYLSTLSFQTVKRTTFQGLPLEIKWSEAAGFRAKPNNRSSTQREDSTRAVPPTPACDLQFSTINDSDFQDLSPVQEGTNLQGPSSDLEGATQGWFDVESVPLNESTCHTSAGTAHSDGESSHTTNVHEHSSTTIRRSNRIRRPVERLAFAATPLCTAAHFPHTC